MRLLLVFSALLVVSAFAITSHSNSNNEIDIVLTTEDAPPAPIAPSSPSGAPAPIAPSSGTTSGAGVGVGSDAATLTTFTAGSNSPLPEITIMLINGVPVTRVDRIFDGSLTKSDSDVSLSFNTLSTRLVRLVKKYVNKNGVNRKETKFSFYVKGDGNTIDRVDLDGVQVLGFTLPPLGKKEEFFTLRLHYHSTTTTKNVKMQSILDHPVRSEFFKLNFKELPQDKSKSGKALSQQILSINSVQITRPMGVGKLTVKDISLSILHAADNKTLAAWTKWSDKDKAVERDASLVLYHWTGDRYDHTEEGRGQLKPLLTINLSGITVKKFDASTGRVVLSVKNAVVA